MSTNYHYWLPLCLLAAWWVLLMWTASSTPSSLLGCGQLLLGEPQFTFDAVSALARLRPPGSTSHLDTLDAGWVVFAVDLQHLPHTHAHAGQAVQDGSIKPNTPADLWVNVQRVVVTRQPVHRGKREGGTQWVAPLSVTQLNKRLLQLANGCCYSTTALAHRTPPNPR